MGESLLANASMAMSGAAGLTEEQMEIAMKQMTDNLPPGVDPDKLKAMAEAMLEKTDKDGSGDIDRDEAVAFMTKTMEDQFEMMMEQMPEEVKGMMTPEMLEAQKGPMMAGIDEQVDQMAKDMP